MSTEGPTADFYTTLEFVKTLRRKHTERRNRGAGRRGALAGTRCALGVWRLG